MINEHFHIKSDSPAAPDMMFWRIVGHEAFSRPSAYELTVLSENHELDPDDILGHAFDVVIDFFDDKDIKHKRHCQGHAVRFVRMGQFGRYFEYRIVLRSWFWLLTKRTNSRILQDKSVLEIAKEVFDDSPINKVRQTDPVVLTEKHEPRHYCVQHQESDYQYLSRLFEDEGIYYWFDVHGTDENDDADNTLGTMFLSDTSSAAHKSLPISKTLKYAQGNSSVSKLLEIAQGSSSEARYNSIVLWIDSRQLHSGKYASRDAAYQRRLNTEGNFHRSHEFADFEVFEYPGGHLTKSWADEVRRTRGEELLSRSGSLNWALTHWHDVGVGHTFTFEGDPDDMRNKDYLIAACTFVVSHPGYEAEGLPTQDPPQRSVTDTLREALADDAVNAHCLNDYVRLIDGTPELRTDARGTNAFLITALPADELFKPPRLTPRITMPGPQTAIVVGREGEELDVDNKGRVKVQFHWNRYKNVTCRIRVSQPWAGKGWGGYFMPRIGQEVLVDFVNGDPDRPIIVGRMYNDNQPIPYESATQSGFKTRSTKDGTLDNYNEIMFEDEKGSELLKIHAERNMSTSVEVDNFTSVGRYEENTITVSQTNFIDGKQVSFIGFDEKHEERGQSTYVKGLQKNVFFNAQETYVEGHQENFFYNTQKTYVGEDQTLDVKKNRDVTVVGSQKTVVGENRNVDVGNDQTTKVGGKSELFVTGNIESEIGGNRKDFTFGERKDLTVNKHSIMAEEIKITANTNIELMANKISSTAIDAGTMVLGNTSGGYIGFKKEANLGISSSSFGGLKIENMLGASISNFMALKLDSAPLSTSFSALTVLGPLADTAGIVVDSVGAVIAAPFLISSIFDINATIEDYMKAIDALSAAKMEAYNVGLVRLGNGLDTLELKARKRFDYAKTWTHRTAKAVEYFFPSLAGAVVSPLLTPIVSVATRTTANYLDNLSPPPTQGFDDSEGPKQTIPPKQPSKAEVPDPPPMPATPPSSRN